MSEQDINEQSTREQSIELDCAPMTPRPDCYIAGVLADTGIEVGQPVSKSFGNWKWVFNEVDSETWDKFQPIFAERIKALHSKGCIRYGSW